MVSTAASLHKSTLLPDEAVPDSKLDNCMEKSDHFDEVRMLLASTAGICYNSPESVFVVADEQPPSSTVPGSVGWKYERALGGVGKINWYFYLKPTLFPSIPPSLTSIAPIQYDALKTIFAVVEFFSIPGFQGPYFTLYTDPPTVPNFYKSRLQWRLPSAVLLTGKVLLWAGSTAPPTTLHPELARLQLGSPPQGDVSLIGGVQTVLPEDIIQRILISTDSDSPGDLDRSFTVYELGYILQDTSISSIILSICGSPTNEPTFQPTLKPTSKPSDEPTSKPKSKPPASSKPTPKPTSKPAKQKEAPNKSSKPSKS
jgi:hypothetical protein